MSVTIDCAECVLQGTGACDDCVVPDLVPSGRGGRVVVAPDELAALRALRRGGLAPALRHRRRRVEERRGTDATMAG